MFPENAITLSTTVVGNNNNLVLIIFHSVLLVIVILLFVYLSVYLYRGQFPRQRPRRTFRKKPPTNNLTAGEPRVSGGIRMDIENWPINKPIPFARNARKLSPRAVDKVAASIREFGFRQPVVVDKAGTIICGHTRLQAAQKLGLVEVPVHVAENWTPAQ